MLLMVLKAKKLMERFTKKNCRKQIKKNLELKKKQRQKALMEKL